MTWLIFYLVVAEMPALQLTFLNMNCAVISI
jgi:hypothetical protein